MLPLFVAALVTQAPAPTNTVCPVMGSAVGPKNPVVQVQGRSYRICCAGCGGKLAKDPGKYLDAQGNPKVAAAKKG